MGRSLSQLLTSSRVSVMRVESGDRSRSGAPTTESDASDRSEVQRRCSPSCFTLQAKRGEGNMFVGTLYRAAIVMSTHAFQV